MKMVDRELLKILACPACPERPPLAEDEGHSALHCGLCGRSYPIEKGVPVLLVEKFNGR